MPRPHTNLAGKRFGRLVARGREKIANKTAWLCECDCGQTKVVRTLCLQRGDTQSCGCLQRERSSQSNRTHGLRRTRLFTIWRNMRTRCEKSSDRRYSRYGGRGIAVCAEWADFATFAKWALSNGYDPKLTLDRMDNDGPYAPSNCRWATMSQQARNTSVTKRRADGTAWLDIAEQHGIKNGTLLWRLKHGWPGEVAATTPTGKKPDYLANRFAMAPEVEAVA